MFFVDRLYFIIQLDRIELVIIFIVHLFYYGDLKMLVGFVFLMCCFVSLYYGFVFILHFF